MVNGLQYLEKGSTMKFKAAFDSGDGSGLDRFTIQFQDAGETVYFGMSIGADRPGGFCCVADVSADYLNECKQVNRGDLPAGVQRQIERIEKGV